MPEGNAAKRTAGTDAVKHLAQAVAIVGRLCAGAGPAVRVPA
jgi:hypothetical protein